MSLSQADAFAITKNDEPGDMYRRTDVLRTDLNSLAATVGTLTPTLLGAKFFSDCGTVAEGGYLQAVSGTAASVGAASSSDIPSGSNWCGVLSLSTGTDTTGRAAQRTGTTIFNTALGQCIYQTVIAIPTLSDGTNTYTMRLGFKDTDGSDPTDGAYFVIGGGNANFRCRTRAATTQTEVDSGVAVVAATEYTLFVIMTTSAALFYVNNTLVANITTNIPTGWAQSYGAGAEIFKSAGGTARVFVCDMQLAYQNLTTPRNWTVPT